VKADLHLHSRHSERSPEWVFRRAGLAGSYSEPAALYEALRARGMDLVTLTDDNSIAGCLEIADRPGVFLSEQVSAAFPEDRCPVHLLVWGLREGQHAEIQRLRENIYELQAYLAQEQLAHAVAHPLHRLNGKFSGAHLEKLILLFRHFEARNGLRDNLLSDTAAFLLRALTPAKLEELANRHNLAPTHPEPWRKALTGGSDDHGGMNAAHAWTHVSGATSADEFLTGLRAGFCEPGGAGGSPLVFSHALYNNLRQLISARFSEAGSSSLIGKAFSRFMEGEDPTEFSWLEKIGFVAQGIATGKIFELAKPANASLWRQFADTFAHSDIKEILNREAGDIAEPERRAFTIANHFANQLAFRIFTGFVKQLSSGNIIEAIRELSLLLPILATLLPYVYGFRSQAPDRGWLAELCRELAGELPPALRNTKRAWFTDTLEDVNGVTTTIRRLTAACRTEGYDLTVVTSRETIQISEIPIKNFTPIGEFELPEYELQKLSFPPVLQMLDYIHREGFTELIISTPGPVGLTALLAAKMLGLRSSGIYHTDFPQYVRILSDDSSLETLTWNYMRWFYEQLDLIYVNSEGYRQAWIARGIAEPKLRILPRGLDTTLFHPSRRTPGFWAERGIPADKKVLLYVGRISKEKDLDVIAAAWQQLRGDGAALAFVGEGPYQKEFRQSVPEAVFTGALMGEELAQAFASADLFLFPSTTDTFGNVIIEALASGLPCVVSDQGGPKDLIEPGRTGSITRALDVAAFAREVRQLLSEPAKLEAMREAARATVENRDWLKAAREFWATADSG
jgi:glycosyltransferase involved in cell wall biosynthesis